MYLAATTTSQTQIPFYISILKGFTSDYSVGKDKFDSALLEAISVAKEEKSIFTINNDNYFLVSTLVSKNKDFLIKLDDKKIDSSVYQQIIKILSEDI
jgi:hypothetical protein